LQSVKVLIRPFFLMGYH